MSGRRVAVATVVAVVGLVVVLVVGRHDVVGLIAVATLATYLVATVLLLHRNGGTGRLPRRRIADGGADGRNNRPPPGWS